MLLSKYRGDDKYSENYVWVELPGYLAFVVNSKTMICIGLAKGPGLPLQDEISYSSEVLELLEKKYSYQELVRRFIL